MSTFPRRIVCLTDETTEVLYLLGEQDRIVGVFSRPSRRNGKKRKRERGASAANEHERTL